MELNQIQNSMEETEELSHKRFGHLNKSSIQVLAVKEMVSGLPGINMDEAICEVCMKGKKNQEAIPKQSVWRASRGLELVHSEIFGPISPISESGKRYIINFTDDYSR